MESKQDMPAVSAHAARAGHQGSGRRGRASIIEDLCTGCAICVKSCPTSCISIVESELNFTGVAAVDGVRCTGCNICAIDCPWLAIAVFNPDGSRRPPATYARQAGKLRGYL